MQENKEEKNKKEEGKMKRKRKQNFIHITIKSRR